MTELQKKKKIFVFFPCEGKIGGAERRLIRTFSYINNSNENYDFTLGLLALTEINEESVKKSYKEFSDIRIRFFYKQSKLFYHVLRSEYSLVCYTDCSFRCIPVLSAALLSNKKRFMMCTDTMGSSQNLEPKVRQCLYNLDVLLSNRVDCLYPSNTELLKSKFKKKEITVTPCSFTDIEKYYPTFPKKKEIVFLGRLVEFKGIMLFVNSVIKIADSIRKNGFECNIYGHGNLENKIKEIIIQNNCQDIIHCVGHIDDSYNALTRSRIFCSLQRLGNYPSQSLLEAMACGNYCIVTNTYDSNLLVNDSFGILINDDVDSLSEALLEAMRLSESEYIKISEEARSFLKVNHNIQRSAEYFENIFYNLLN